jgi:hypothetical protein
MRRFDKVSASVSCASQADQSLNYDKLIATDFRDDRDHGGTILVEQLIIGGVQFHSVAFLVLL